MKKRTIPLIASIALLPSCALFDNSDPREGVESAEACLQRLGGERKAEDFELADLDGQLVVPTYTYDITKVSLDDIQSLIVAGSDETAGSRGMTSTNETSTAVDQFMAQRVDEKGSFFFARDPALYRVRGETVAVGEVVSTGCARQLEGMRLTSVTAELEAAEPPAEEPEDADPDSTSDNENDS